MNIKDTFVSEVYDFNSQDVGQGVMNQLKQLLYDKKVVVIKHQTLSPEGYLRMMKTIGKPIHHVLKEFSLPSFPEIIKISNFIHENGQCEGVLDGGAYWHSDMSYYETVGVATSLYAQQVPNDGGQTHFINLEDGLSKLLDSDVVLAEFDRHGLKLDEVDVYHKFGNRRKVTDACAVEQKLSEKQWQSMRCVRHKLIETHPVTGKKSLFAISGSAFLIDGLSEKDSIDLLNNVEEVVLSHADCYQHTYTKGDLVIWDNMSTLHSGVNIQASRDRLNHRLLYRINVNYCSDQSYD